LANTTTSCSLDNAKFEDLWLYWLNPISAGALQTDSKMKPKGKSDFRCEDPCDRWNQGVCHSKASECKRTRDGIRIWNYLFLSNKSPKYNQISFG
jgi:hypothetical protein